LFQVVAALHAPGRFSRRLDSWKQKPNENSNDGDDYQQLYECKASPRRSIMHDETPLQKD
jgi:hypothetical protein